MRRIKKQYSDLIKVGIATGVAGVALGSLGQGTIGNKLSKGVGTAMVPLGGLFLMKYVDKKSRKFQKLTKQ